MFTNEQYLRAGAELVEDLEPANVILGVKEVPLSELLPDKTYDKPLLCCILSSTSVLCISSFVCACLCVCVCVCVFVLCVFVFVFVCVFVCVCVFLTCWVLTPAECAVFCAEL